MGVPLTQLPIPLLLRTFDEFYLDSQLDRFGFHTPELGKISETAILDKQGRGKTAGNGNCF